jgi:hypothetical protein
VRRAALLFTVVAGVLGLAGTPAAAHGGDAPDATAYRTTVTAVSPPEPGLTVRAVEAGARLELVNRTGRTIEVLGYAGEPYLELRPDGVHVNVASPAAYLNETLAGNTAVPATADPTAPPRWRRVSGDASVRWHDRRTHWTESAPPAATRAEPGRTHRLRDWSVPLRDGVRTFEIRGTLDWMPPPAPGPWWWGALVVAAGCVVARRTRIPLAAAATVAAATTIGYAVARQVDAGATTVATVLAGLLGAQLTVLTAAAGALLAAVLLVARRPAADFALALAGAVLLLFAGLADIAVFTDAVAPAPGPSWWPRVAVAVAVGVGAGLTAAGLLRLRAAAPRPSTRPWKLPATTS